MRIRTLTVAATLVISAGLSVAGCGSDAGPQKSPGIGTTMEPGPGMGSDNGSGAGGAGSGSPGTDAPNPPQGGGNNS